MPYMLIDSVNHPAPQVFNKHLIGDSDIAIALEVDGSIHIPRAKLGDLLKVGGPGLGVCCGKGGLGGRDDAGGRARYARPSATSLYPTTQGKYSRLHYYT